MADKITCFSLSGKQLWYFSKNGGVVFDKDRTMKLTFIPALDKILIQVSTPNDFVKDKLPKTSVNKAEYI